MQFEILEHTADIGFRAWGDSVEEAFANCAHALISIILDPADVTEKEQVTLTADGSDLESLLVNFLNELLYYIDTKRLAFSRFAIRLTEPYELVCEATGERRTPEKHPVRLSVKAVTYHQLRVSKVGNTWIAEVFVDV